jgi:hypothetical protein
MRQYALATVALAADLLQLVGVYWDVGWHHAFPRLAPFANEEVTERVSTL